MRIQPALVCIGIFLLGTLRLDAVLTFTFSPGDDDEITVLTLSGYSSTINSGFEVYDRDGLWDFLDSEGEDYRLVPDKSIDQSLVINPGLPSYFELSIFDTSNGDPSGSDGLFLDVPFGFGIRNIISGSGTTRLELPFSTFNPGSGVSKNAAGAPFAVVVRDGDGPVAAVPEPSVLILIMAVGMIGFAAWRQYRRHQQQA